MKDTKTEWKFFSIADWEKEEQYLRRQHQNGWKFTGVSFLMAYHFVRCEPEDVVYQLDYNPAANKQEYLQIFRDCGWEYLQDYVGYSYFRKPASAMQGEEAIFSDDASRLDMLRRIIKGRMLPLLPIFLLCVLPNLLRPVNAYSGSVEYALLGMFIFLGALYSFVFVYFGWQFYKLYNRLQRK